MSGIYLHIPFCKQACHYCDFHFSTNIARKREMIGAIAKELALRKNYLSDDQINTIYFGGGTPSLMTEAELAELMGTIARECTLAPDAEVTLEANPDDISEEKLAIWKQHGINRLSIGIQSFHDPHLSYLHRAHDAAHAKGCVQVAQQAGFQNLTIDLIYGIPADSHTIWERDVAEALALGVPHISAYCLTIEPQTVFGNWLKKKKIRAVDDDFAATQFDHLVERLSRAGLEQYEVSNFARSGWHSRHNSAYWFQVSYLGVGPGAHSYNRQSRQANVSNNALYIKAIAQGQIPAEVEMLGREDHINEYLLTTLRTKWGTDLAWLKEHHGYDLVQEKSEAIARFQRAKWLYQEEGRLFLTQAGKLLADTITGELFV